MICEMQTLKIVKGVIFTLNSVFKLKLAQMQSLAKSNQQPKSSNLAQKLVIRPKCKFIVHAKQNLIVATFVRDKREVSKPRQRHEVIAMTSPTHSYSDQRRHN